MKLSEFEGEAALDALADIIEPVVEICADKKIAQFYKSGQKIKAVQHAIKEHKRAVITILAIMEQENPDTYKPKLVTLPLKLLEILNDPDIVAIFQQQGQSLDASSGSATGSTEASVK